jgi:CO/xanthine dehydrogenase Mo-binding subunit
MTGTPGGAIGVSRPRPDGPPKVRGAIRYGADRAIPGWLHARLVLATPAHARIASIDKAAALAVPGVVAVLVAADLPIKPGDPDRMAIPLAADEVVFAGQPVAMVVAKTATAAADGAELVVARYDLLPAVVDAVAAMDPDAPLARHIEAEATGAGPSMDAQTHAAVGGAGDASIDDEALSTNVKGRHRYRAGDVRSALDGAAVVAGGRFTTSWVHQGYLEPSVSTARLDDDGTLVIETATQSIFGVRNDLARVLGLPHHRIRVVGTPLGGAFGGKWSLFESLVAAATLILRRPVRLVLDRGTDLRITNPGQGFDLDVRIGADAEGRFVGLEARIVADSGAFEDTAFEGLAGVLIAGPYAWPAFDIRAYGVRTNRFGVGPYRAPTAPPMCFALETLVDELAAELGLDPLDVRVRNAAVAGSPMVDGEPWAAMGLQEVIAGLRATPLWQARAADEPGTEGTGVAVAYWPGSTDPASAVCRVSPDGSVQVVTGVVDMSGVAGGFQAIAAGVLGVDPAAVESVFVDTGSAPPSPGSGGSTITYSAGRAIRAAAEDARTRLLEAAALQLEIDPADLELVDGTIRPKGTPERAIPIAKVVRANARAGRAPIEGHANTEQLSLAPSVAGHVARVRVDRETGEVAVLADHVVQDVGRALNPALVTDQQHGGAAQGIGWALRERLVHDAAGQLSSGTFMDYALPRIQDVGALTTTIVEVPAPDGPFGAKGIGEAPVIAGAAAIGNAIAAATGVRLRTLPMTPPVVRRALTES